LLVVLGRWVVVLVVVLYVLLMTTGLVALSGMVLSGYQVLLVALLVQDPLVLVDLVTVHLWYYLMEFLCLILLVLVKRGVL